MGKFITLQSTDGFSLPAYVAEPAGQAKGAIVVVQEIFGVNAHIQEVSDRFAAQGYLAITPAAFERVRPGVDLGYDENTIKEGIALKTAAMALPADAVLQDIQAAIDFAGKTSGGKVGIIGFCWGGLLTWQAACKLNGLSAAVPYYGGGMVVESEMARKPKVPVMAHFSDHDHSVPMEGVEDFEKAHPEVAVHIYNADHGFNCDHRGAYNEAAAQLARERTLGFFASQLA